MKTALRMGVLASTCILLTGCQLFGLSAEEQTKVQSIRELKKYLSPGSNKPLNEFFRNWGHISDFDLPTEYGVDLSNYISLLPFQGAGDLANRRNPPEFLNTTNKEIKTVRDSSNQTQFDFTATSQSLTDKTHAYAIKLTKSRLGSTGNFSVTTTGGSWKQREGQASPPTNGRYGYGYYAVTPQSVAMKLTGTVSGKPIALNASLLQFSQVTPTTGTFEIQLPDIVFKADSVRFTSINNVTMSGALGVGPSDQGEVFEGDLRLNGGTIEGNFSNPKRAYSVSFTYDGSALTAEFKSSGNNSKNLAVIDFENERQVIKFADGGVEDFPLKVTK